MTLASWLRSVVGGLRGAWPSSPAIPRWSRVEAILGAALDLPRDERDAYITRACSDDVRLRDEVLGLAAASEAPGLIDRPLDAMLTPLLDADEVPTTEVAPTVIAHYELLERIPGGGMGVIYRARDTRLQRTVALKCLPAALIADPRAKSRFLLEARAAAALDHRNVCAIHEIGETGDGQLFIAMPFYAGETIAGRLARGPLPIHEAVSLASQVAFGLAHAHERGIVHRDIKPANLMLTPERVVKILDFGIAKLQGVGLTRTGAAVGTLPYMSPERLRRDAVDGRTDIWSLGVVLYEMLAGRRPFDDSDDHALREGIAFAQPASLPAIRPEIPDGLARLVNHALAKHPDDRPASVELAATLETLLSGLPVACAGVPETTGRGRAGRAGDGANIPGDTARVLPGGERRQATVVVSSLSGYGELVERCAPHEVDEVIRRLKRDAWEIVERHGGTINEFSEERIVLLFGVPMSQEDHCVRAFRAAIDLRALVHRWRATRPGARGLALHTAIDSGEAAVQRLDASIVPYRIAGRPARRATQLCAHAHTDEILVSPDAERAAGKQFEVAAAAPVSFADDDEPLVPFTVIRERDPQDRLDQMEGRADLTAFTGRDPELAALVQAFADAQVGQGLLVTVTGEAGVGKSRLLLEFRRTLDPASVMTLVGRCSAYGQATPYLPLLQAMRQLLRLEPFAGTGWTDADIAARISEAGSDLEQFLPYYLRLLSIATGSPRSASPEAESEISLMVQDALVALFVGAAKRRPLVLLLEDWHWVDTASHGALVRLADVLPDHSMLMVVTTRSAQVVDGQPRDSHRGIALRPLSSGTSTGLLRAVLAADEVPVELSALVYERTGGNPFFLEEIARSLLEDGTIRVEARRARVAGSLETVDMPPTVQAVIRARLDRLDLDVRHVLRAASVVGRDFTRAILMRVVANPDRVGPALERLGAAGIIRQTAARPEPMYRFRHALTQEAAYAGLLEHQRADLHARVGTAIEELYGGQLDDRLDRLAQHFSIAEDWPRAVHYGLASAGRMRGLHQFVDALRVLDRTREWVALLGEVGRREPLIEVLFLQERSCEALGERERQRQIVDELVGLLGSGADPSRLAEAYLRKGEMHTFLCEYDLAEEALDRSLQLRRESGDAPGERASLRGLSFLRWSQQRREEALAYSHAALRIDRQQGRLNGIVGDLHNLGTLYSVLDNPEQARACLEEALTLSEPAKGRANPAFFDLWEARVPVLYSYGCLLARAGDLDGALAYLGADGEWTSQIHQPMREGHFFTAAAHVHLKKGMIAECLEDYRRAVEVTRRAHLAPQLGLALQLYGETLITLGRERESLGALDEAARVYAALADPTGEARAWSQIARAHERLGNVTEAQSSWERTLALRRSVGDRQGEVDALEAVGRVARRHLPASVALRFYDEAISRATEAGDHRRTARLHNSAGIIEWTRGQYERALAHFERALDSFQTLDDVPGAGLMMNSIGVSLSALGRRVEARERLHQAVAQHERTAQPRLEGHALAALGDVCWESGETDDAAGWYDRSLRLRQAIGDLRGEGWMLQRLARAKSAAGDPEGAEMLVARAAELSTRCSDEELMDACAQLRRTIDRPWTGAGAAASTLRDVRFPERQP